MSHTPAVIYLPDGPVKPRRKRTSILVYGVALGAIAVLSSCTTLGTNVRGSFRCDAPDGVCAPSTVIDDGALAEIETVSSGDLLQPAGPYQIDDGVTAVVGSQLAGSDQLSRPAQTYRLNVVFPAYVDASGKTHQRASIVADVQLPGRGDALEALARRGDGPVGPRGLLAAAESAPPILAIAVPNGNSNGSVVADIASRSAYVARAQEGAKPQNEASADPVEDIRQDVAAALGRRAVRRQAASFPGISE